MNQMAGGVSVSNVSLTRKVLGNSHGTRALFLLVEEVAQRSESTEREVEGEVYRELQSLGYSIQLRSTNNETLTEAETQLVAQAFSLLRRVGFEPFIEVQTSYG